MKRLHMASSFPALMLCVVLVGAQDTRHSGNVRPFGRAGDSQESAEVSDPQTSRSVSLTFGTIDFPEVVDSQAVGISKQGVVAGGYGPDLVPLNAANHGFVLQGTSFRKIDYPGATHTVATDVNETGHIIGTFNSSSGLSGLHGFELVGKTFTQIDFPGAIATEAVGINKSGEIVGFYDDASEVAHGFSLVGATFTSIDVPGAAQTFAEAIDTAGDIVGVYTDGGGHDHGFLLQRGKFTTIDFSGATDTWLLGINDKGQMVGSYGTAVVVGFQVNHGFLLSGGAFTTIDVPFASAAATLLYKINNSGQAVGFYLDTNSTYFGFSAGIGP